MGQAGLLLHHVLFEAAQLAAEVVQLPRVKVTASVLSSSLEPLLTSEARMWGGHLLVMIHTRLLPVVLLCHEVKLSSE